MSDETRSSSPDAAVQTDAPRNARLDKALARTSDAPLRKNNHLELLKDGSQTFDDWLAAIGRAERWIRLENYIFTADETGKRFSEALCEKALAGVSVRVLYDWFGCLDVSRSYWQEMRKAGVDVRVVNPPTMGTPLGIIRRDHRKLIGVDGLYGSTGGVCISGDWLVSSPETGLPYRDTAVSVRGPAVADIERDFAGTWDESGRSLPKDERPEAARIEAAGGADVRVVVQHAQDAHAGVAHRRGRGAVVGHRRLLPLYADPHPIPAIDRPGWGGRAGARTRHQRHSLDRGRITLRIPSVPGSRRPDLRVLRTHDPRQDHHGRRLVVQSGLYKPKYKQPRRQLGDRPGRRRQGLREENGRPVRGRHRKLAGDPAGRVH